MPIGAGAGAARKKIPGAGAAWEKNQEPEPLEKKSGAGAAQKFAVSPALVIIRIYFSSPRQLNLMTTSIMQATSTPTRKVYSLSSEVSAKITQFFLHILYM